MRLSAAPHRPPAPRVLAALVLACAVAGLAGCATSYIAPGAKADLQSFAPPAIQESFATKPSSPFPAAIALVRVQGAAYSNYNLQHSGAAAGGGRYRVITTREVEDESQLERVAHLPQVEGVTTLNRMLLPDAPGTEKDLREAAARLHADLVLLYTFDTSFFDQNESRPLSMISLGFLPTRRISVATTASALLVDTRTGYVYSTYESTKKADTQASVWGSAEAADESRRNNERAAFADLVDEFTKSWPQLVERYGRKG